jgi:hypothetical protein
MWSLFVQLHEDQNGEEVRERYREEQEVESRGWCIHASEERLAA